MVCLAVARSSFIHQTHKQTSKLIHTQINESMDVHKISLVCKLLRIISISIINVCSHWRRHNHLSWSWMSCSRSRILSLSLESDNKNRITRNRVKREQTTAKKIWNNLYDSCSVDFMRFEAQKKYIQIQFPPLWGWILIENKMIIVMQNRHYH